MAETAQALPAVGGHVGAADMALAISAIKLLDEPANSGGSS